MFQHKAIENLWNSADYDSNFNVIFDLSIKKKEFDEVVEDLRKAQNFYLGKDDWLKRFVRKGNPKEEILKAEDLQSLRLPYDNTTFWLERENDGTRVGINAIGPQEAGGIFVRYIFNQSFEPNRWYVWPVANIIFLDRPQAPQSERVGPIFLSEKKYGDIFYNDEMKHTDYLTRGYCLAILEYALTVLSCRNITYETIDPPEKLNKKRRKKGKEELVSYHVLKIAPMSPKKQTRCGVTGTGESPRVHLCRGHFKTYTEDSPLFGRYTGRFWWQPQVRGEKQKGIVQKDYNVEV